MGGGRVRCRRRSSRVTPTRVRSAAFVAGDAGDSETDVVTASGTDDDGSPVSDSDDATVTVERRLVGESR